MFTNGTGKITKKLDELAAIQDALEGLQAGLEYQIKLLIPPDVQAAIDEVTAEVLPKIERASEKIEELRAVITRLTLEHGETVQGEHVQAVYARGRVTWDSKGLEGYAVANPDVLNFKRVGKPYVSISERKGKK